MEIKNIGRCIICREDSVQLTDEHVIPDALGGVYHIYNVCKNCNSEMGIKIDNYLTNNKISQFYRDKHSIKGKTGDIPNPLSDIFYSDDKSQKMQFRRNNDHQLLPYIFQKNEIVRNEKGIIEKIIISCDESDKHKVKKELKKILSRNKLKESDISEVETKTIFLSDSFKASWTLELDKLKIGILKIAYEFAVDKVEKYFSDKNAVKISKILKDADYEKASKYVNVGNGFDMAILKPFESFIDFDKKRHILILSRGPQGLICIVSLNEMFHFGVNLSPNNLLPFNDSLIGINDLDGKNFTVKRLEDIFHEIQGDIKLDFYDGDINIKELEDNFEVLEHYYDPMTNKAIKDRIPLYDKNGIFIKYLHEQNSLLTNNSELSSKLTREGSEFKAKIKDRYSDLYIQSRNTMKFFRLTSIVLTQSWKRIL